MSHLVAGFLVLAVAGVTQYILGLRDEQSAQATQRNVAESKSEESNLRLERRYIAEGVGAVQADDLTSALPWFAEALRMAEASKPGDLGRLERIKAHRVRLGNALRSVAAPIGVFRMGAACGPPSAPTAAFWRRPTAGPSASGRSTRGEISSHPGA